MPTNSESRRFAQEIARLRRDLDALQRSTQLGNSSIEGGALKVYDDSGVLRHIIGEQADGTYAYTDRNAPAPDVVPSAPTVESNAYVKFVAWDGQTSDGSLLPYDFASVEVYAAAANDFATASHVASIPSITGSTVALPPSTPTYIWLTIRNTSGAESEPSVAGT